MPCTDRFARWCHHFCLFLAEENEERTSEITTSVARKLTTRPPQSAMGALQKSPNTTETPGASSAPRLPCTPSNEHAKALAAAHDKMEPHRCKQDWRARARSGLGVERAESEEGLRFLRERTACLTRNHDEFSTAFATYELWIRALLVTTGEGQSSTSSSAQRRCGSPSARSGETRVASIAN